MDPGLVVYSYPINAEPQVGIEQLLRSILLEHK